MQQKSIICTSLLLLCYWGMGHAVTIHIIPVTNQALRENSGKEKIHLYIMHNLRFIHSLYDHILSQLCLYYSHVPCTTPAFHRLLTFSLYYSHSISIYNSHCAYGSSSYEADSTLHACLEDSDLLFLVDSWRVPGVPGATVVTVEDWRPRGCRFMPWPGTQLGIPGSGSLPAINQYFSYYIYVVREVKFNSLCW